MPPSPRPSHARVFRARLAAAVALVGLGLALLLDPLMTDPARSAASPIPERPTRHAFAPVAAQPPTVSADDPGKPSPAAGSGPSSANLVVEDFVASPFPVVAGRDAEIAFSVKNLGPARATGVRLFNRLPNGVRTRGLRPSAGNCSYQGGIVCDLGDIEPGGEVRVTVDGIADPGIAGEGSYRAQAVAREPDPTPRDNTGTLVVPIAPAPDLLVRGDVSPKIASVGDELTYSFTVTNRGPGSVSNVRLSTSYDPGSMRVVRFEPGCPVLSDAAGPQRFPPDDCRLGDLASGQSAVATLVARATRPGAHRHTIRAFADETARDRDHQDDEVWVAIDPTVDLAAMLAGPAQPVRAGEPATYTVTVENRAAATAEGVLVVVPVPLNTQLVASRPFPDGRGCAWAGETEVWCGLGTLPGGASATTTFARVAGPVGEVTASARVRTEGLDAAGDLDPSNDVATPVTTTVVPRDCAPRPPIRITTDPGAPDRLRALVEATANEGAPENRLGRLRFGVADGAPAPTENALLDIPERPDGVGVWDSGRSGTFDVELGRLDRAIFFVRRAQPGAPVRVPLTVEDDCGSLSTVIEGGAAPWGNAFEVHLSSSAAGPVRVGERVTYTATVTNVGETGAAGSVAVATLPAGLELVSANAGRGGCDVSGRVICEIGRLERGADVTVTLVVEARRPGPHVVTAYAASEAFDRAGDNRVDVLTDVAP